MEKIKKSRAVPFQVCPMCKGQGTVTRHFLGREGITYSAEKCDVCEGAKVIPMCVV